MTKTETTWNTPGLPTLETSDIIKAKAAQMQLEGKTDNISVTCSCENNTLEVKRTWTTLENAQEWVAFMSQYSADSTTNILV
jgi:hypothetical protein